MNWHVRNQKVEWSVITGASIAALVIVALFLHTQHSNRFSQIESHGLSLVQSLSRAPYSQLVPQGPEQSLLHFVKTSQSDTSFAYIVVTDIDNNVMADVSRDGVNPPVHRIGKLPSFWFGTRDVSSSSDSTKFREYYAPVIVDEALMGHLRIGYRIPILAPLTKNLPLYSMLVLPVFLLAFVFHLLLRKQLQPLAGIHRNIQSLTTTAATANLDKSGLVETDHFLSTINTSINNLAQRTDELETQNRESQTSSKVISFQRARLQSILHSLPYGIVVVDESGSISFANSQCGMYMGVVCEDIIGKKPNQVCTRPEVLDFFNRYSGQDVSKVGSMKFSLSDTTEIYVNATAYPLFSRINSGQVSGNLVIFRDITEEQMARESRNEFIAQVGHELKTPMQIMGMYSEMLIDDTQASRELQLEVANVFNDQIDRINTLISNLLNVSKIEMGAISLDRQKVKLTALLDGIYHYFEKSAEESGIGLAIECNIDLSPIYIDKELFRIAINNLVSNAIKYSDRGGRVIILVEDSDQAITVTVSDTGIGIYPEDQPRIFERFFRADNDSTRERSGHGLGLGLSKDIVEAHQGTIVVSSVPGQGTEFKIELQKTTMLLKEAA